MTPNEINLLADALAERLSGRIGGGDDQVGSVHDAAGWLGCSVPTIERAVRRGEIQSFTVGRLRRFRRADVLKGKGGNHE